MNVRRRISTFGAAAVLAVALGTGGYAFTSGSTQAAADTYTAPVAVSVAPLAQDNVAAQSIYDQQIAYQKAAAQAQAAAEAVAVQAAADVAKKAASHVIASCPDGTSPQAYNDANQIITCSQPTAAGGLKCPSGTSPQAYNDAGQVTACTMPSAPGGLTCPPGQAPQAYNDKNQVTACG